MASRVLAAASASSGPDRVLVGAQRIGARGIALFPASIDELRAITQLVDELFHALNRRNDAVAGADRVRLGMAIHEGITRLPADGFTGPAVTKTCQLLDSQPLLATFALDPDANLVVMVSDQVFTDMDESGNIVLPVDRFRRVEVGDRPDGHRDIVWIYVPSRWCDIWQPTL